MEDIWLLVIAGLIFIAFTILFLRLGRAFVKQEYGSKMWNHWPSKLFSWQAAIFYSLILTVITLFLLRWTNVLTF